jgi:N-dimethylarginine dimethylaminohydrolase
MEVGQKSQALKINVNTEFGKLKLAVVHQGRNLVDYQDAIKTIFRLNPRDAQRAAKEEDHHPESGKWKASRARMQISGLVGLLQERGIKLLFSTDVENQFCQFFTRDVGFVVGNTLYVAKRTDEYRRREIEGLTDILSSIQNVMYLNSGRIEGGSVLVNKKTVYVGLDDRTDRKGFDAFKKLAEREENGGFSVVPISLQPGVLHLDCRFNIIGECLAVAYPPHIETRSLKALESRFEIIPLTREENDRLAANFLVLDRNIIISEVGNGRLNNIFRVRDFEVLELPYDEPIKIWGSLRCSVLPLYRSE